MVADHDAVARLLKTARGQLDGLLKMIEDDRYCVDISNQILAVSAILRKANRLVLEAHLGSCVKQAFENRDVNEQEKKITEIMNLLEKMIK